MAVTPMVKVIYGKPMLPDLGRVLACLYEKEIKFELEDMNKGIKMSQEILSLQTPSHVNTPALQDGTDELFGSRKICRHILEKYRAKGYQYLLGKDPLARVSVEQWIQSEEHSFDPPSSNLVFYLAYKIEAEEEKASQSEKKLAKVLNLYEQRLGECEFLAGNYFTLADLYHLPNTHYLESSVEYGYLFKDRENVSRWWKTISDRDSWKQVVKKFEEEGLPLDKSEADLYTSSSSSPGKIFTGVPVVAVGSEIGGNKEEPNADIRENKGDLNRSAKKNESTPSLDKIEDNTVQSKTEGKNDETPSTNNKTELKDEGKKEPTPSLEKKEDDTMLSNTKGKKDETPLANNKEQEKTELKEKGKEHTQKTDEIKDRDTNMEATYEKSESPKPDVNDKASSGDGRKSSVTDESKDNNSLDKSESQGKTDENKEQKATDPVFEGTKDGQKSDNQDKASSRNKKEADPNKESDNLGTNESDNQGKRSLAPDVGGEKISSGEKEKKDN